MKNRITLVSGGINSGKSSFAELQLINRNNVTYIATGTSSKNDVEWEEKISKHKNKRPHSWTTIETNVELNYVISCQSPKESLLIDSLGGFISSNLSFSSMEWEYIMKSFIFLLSNHQNDVIIVAEEVGFSPVSSTAIGRLFQNRLGLITQRLEDVSHHSFLLIHGKAINLKSYIIN